MDNGHSKGNTENPYFTAGAGNILPEVNDDLENSIDKEEWQRSLEISTPAGMPTPEQIANTEIASTEDAGLYTAENPTSNDSTSTPQESKIIKMPENPYELGQIAPADPISPKNPTPEAPRKYNVANIKTTGDKLEKSTIPEVDNVISELNQTGNIKNFYDEVRGTNEKPGMMEANLRNSYHRELGQDQQRRAA